MESHQSYCNPEVASSYATAPIHQYATLHHTTVDQAMLQPLYYLEERHRKRSKAPSDETLEEQPMI